MEGERLQLSDGRHLRSGVEDRGDEERRLRARLDGTPRVAAAVPHLEERELEARLERRRAAHEAVPVQMREDRILACGARTTAAKQLVGRPLHRQRRSARLTKHELEQTVLDQAERLLGREPELSLLVDAKHVHVAALLPLHEGQLLVRVPPRHAHEGPVPATRRLELPQPLRVLRRHVLRGLRHGKRTGV
eukprot:scaffold48331_cov66-Phaeocystis_antarctica.AAC.1